jgi:hypothetical protein
MIVYLAKIKWDEEYFLTEVPTEEKDNLFNRDREAEGK